MCLYDEFLWFNRHELVMLYESQRGCSMSELDEMYTRCAGSLPRSVRERVAKQIHDLKVLPTIQPLHLHVSIPLCLIELIARCM